jgi:peptidoglycan/LPS O-acetylase OafA/YrhL
MMKPGDAHSRNNFDFLRIVAALMVLVSHQQALIGSVEWIFAGWQSLGGIAVFVFFVMSGFLVCDSWWRDPNVVRFAARRLLRIWPGLVVVVIISTFLIGPLLTSLDLRDYAATRSTYRYLNNVRFEDVYLLPGVFDGNPMSAVNGSLWTLPIEVRWYAYLGLAGVLGVVRWRYLLLAITIGVAIHYFIIFDVQSVMASGGERRWTEELGVYFLAGACLQRFQAEWRGHRLLFGSVIAAMAFCVALTGRLQFAFWIGLPPLIIAIALASWPGLRRAARFGDLSYGVYIYAFPVQQTIVALTANRLSLYAGMTLSAAVTLVLAFASWHLVEAPTLAWKPSRQSRFGSWRHIKALASSSLAKLKLVTGRR